MSHAVTIGVHHIGFTVSKLAETAAFFTELLGWQELRRDNAYPAIFVSDGTQMVSLWQAKSTCPEGFDKDRHVGLHHVAFAVASKELLLRVHERIAGAGLKVEFAPELLRTGPAMHMMCYEPSGIRVEFIWPG